MIEKKDHFVNGLFSLIFPFLYLLSVSFRFCSLTYYLTSIIYYPLPFYTFSVPRTATSLEMTPIAMPDPRSPASIARKCVK